MTRNYIAALCALVLLGPAAFAQGAGEALLFSENNYYGTARTVAMGSAFTALGGDLGSLGINPAGSAVNNWSQVTITPAVTIYSGNSSYDGGAARSNTRGRMNLPNLGAILNFSTSRRSGLMNMSFGFVMNTTDIYNKDFTASGSNDKSSYMGYLADYASYYNLTSDQMNDLDKLSYYSDIPSAMGHQALVVNPASAGGNAPYVSPVQQNYGTTGPYPMRGTIDQSYGFLTRGYKRDLTFNFGMNFSNRVFVGFNLGTVALNYRQSEYIKEVAQNTSDFPITVTDSKGIDHQDEFSDMTFNYNYRASGRGIYGKIGLIVVPFQGLRIGMAAQTPTSTNITETRYFQMTTNIPEKSTGFSDGADLDSGDYVYEYHLRLPARYNFGLAYTIGNFGLISVDYEFSNYKRAKYREINSNNNSAFQQSNDDVANLLAMAHYVRVGAEVKPLPQMALRAGYNFASAPKISSYGFGGNIAASAPSEYYNSISAGVGYNSLKSFFCDLALRCKINPTEYYYPYPTYIAGYESPEIAVRSTLWDVMLTLGLRF